VTHCFHLLPGTFLRVKKFRNVNVVTSRLC
jgi:hypothetical protein